jgi:hypothetical protein
MLTTISIQTQAGESLVHVTSQVREAIQTARFVIACLPSQIGILAG